MNKFVTFICLLLFVSTQGQTAIFNSLLKKNVDRKGMVDYQSLKKNETILDNYLTYLQETIPTENWSLNKEKAYWLNTYNAYTIKIILTKYPLKSIREFISARNGSWSFFR
jgi:hypothetical protein